MERRAIPDAQVPHHAGRCGGRDPGRCGRIPPSDARDTGFGAFLRRWSLDELPQFINVLRGEMSIVGPRPERPEFVDAFKHEIPGYMQKHLVKAGITGWAQVNDLRGHTDLAARGSSTTSTTSRTGRSGSTCGSSR